jgi:hypothetical protein
MTVIKSMYLQRPGAVKEPVDVVFLWWQSNNLGGKDAVAWDPFPVEYKVAIPKGFINYAYNTPPNNTGFQPLDGAYDSVNRRYQHLAQQYSLATEVTNYTGRKLYIVHYAIGSTSLQTDWAPGGTLFNNMINYLKAAIDILVAQNKTPRIVSFIGNGGEQDAQIGVVAGQMKTMLNAFIAAVRGNATILPYFLTPNVNFQIALMGTWSTTQNVAYPQRRLLIRADQAAVASEGVNIQNYETEDLPSVVGDEIHRTTAAHFTMGLRVANNLKGFLPVG